MTPEKLIVNYISRGKRVPAFVKTLAAGGYVDYSRLSASELEDLSEFNFNNPEGINEFSEGGTHEENPNGGIQLGPNARVEEGETSVKTSDGSFIFSDRLNLDGTGLKPLPNFANGGPIDPPTKKQIDQINQFIDKTNQEVKIKDLEMVPEQTANTWSNMFGNVGKYFLGIEDEDLIESPYKPTVSSDNNVKYHTRKGLKEDVYADLTSFEVMRDYNHSGEFSDIYDGLKSNGKDRKHNADDAFPKNQAGYKGLYNRGHGSFKGEFNLGRYKVDAGEDDKGRYISLYDVYDWNGFQQDNKINFYDRIYEDEWNSYKKKLNNSTKFGLKPIK